MKWLCIVLIGLLSGGCVSTQTAPTAAGEKAKAPEFPQWVKDVRRADIVLFGSFPLTMLFSGIIVDSYRFFANDMDSRYAPLFGSAAKTEDEQIAMITAAAIGSVLVTIADCIIVQYKRRVQRSKTLPEETPIIIRTPPAAAPETETP